MTTTELYYAGLNDYELKRCLIDLHNYLQTCDYPPMADEYKARISEINTILKKRVESRQE